MINRLKLRQQIILEEIIERISIPLYRNAYALIASTILTSGLGFVYWILAAQLYPPEALGLQSAAISSMMLIATLAELNLTNTLMRYLPRAGESARRLILGSYGLSVSLAFFGGIAFVVVYNALVKDDNFLHSSSDFVVWFVVIVMIWCIFHLQDATLTGLREAVYVPIENGVFSVLKIILLVLFVAMPATGIFTAWSIPLLIVIVPINIIIFRKLVPQHMQSNSSNSMPISLRQLSKFVAGDFIGQVFYLSVTMLMPAIIVAKLGPQENAYFYISWTIASSFDLIVMNIGSSLTVEGALNEHRIAGYVREISLHMMRVIGPLVLVVIIFAPVLLRIFGTSYATEGTVLLQLLTLRAVPRAVTIIYIIISRVQQQTTGIVAVQIASSCSILFVSLLLMPSLGLLGVGFAWLISEFVVAFIVLTIKLVPMFRTQSKELIKND